MNPAEGPSQEAREFDGQLAPLKRAWHHGSQECATNAHALRLSHEASPCRAMIVLSRGGCLGGTSQDPVLPIKKEHDFIWCQRVRPEGKAGVLLQERIPSAFRDQAFPLALRAVREGAEPAAIGRPRPGSGLPGAGDPEFDDRRKRIERGPQPGPLRYRLRSARQQNRGGAVQQVLDF